MRTHRQDIAAIIKASLAAVEPSRCVREAVSVCGGRMSVAGRAYDLDRLERIQVIGAGKGSAAMAAGLEGVLGERITGGRISVKYGHSVPLARITVGEAAHPVPDEAGVREAAAALRIAGEAGPRDLVFCLISGGGSSLWPAPVAGLHLEDKRRVTELLLGCGASIDEINTVRKHLSAIKGGQLARAVAPATLISLILSDVIGDRLDVIASGPTCPDRHTFTDAYRILQDHGLAERLPDDVVLSLREGIAGRRPETPKPGDIAFEGTENVVVGSNTMALEAAARESAALGYASRIVTSTQGGDTGAFCRSVEMVWRGIRDRREAPPACILWGGETTMVLGDTPGRGGRNQHAALMMARVLKDAKDVTFASVGTDGTDGPTDAAGGVVDGQTVARGRKAGHDVDRDIRCCDSYAYLSATGDLLKTGPTRTNVMDIQILLVGGSQ